MKKRKNSDGENIARLFFAFFAIIFILILIEIMSGVNSFNEENNNIYSDDVFKIISSSENSVLNDNILNYSNKKGYNVIIDYKDTLDVIDALNSGEKYDAIFMSNSIWLSMLDSSVVKTSNLRSTSITPIIFGIKKSKAESLGLTNKKVYTKDILNKIKTGQLTFSMANPLSTNSGASGYIEVLYNLAGSPEVLKSSHLKDSKLRSELKEFFNGITRTSGDEDFLEKSFIGGDYDAVFTYESSIININKQLEKENKEALYAIYPVDGVAISDNPFIYIDNKNSNKREIFNDLQEFLLSNDGQKILLSNGRRTWYGGINKNAPKDIFNPNWGIDTTTYITPIKYPSVAVINEAFKLYQEELRKPVHVVFCLDYSGSMRGKGYDELVSAMEYILTTDDLAVSFNEKDIIDIIPFESSVKGYMSTKDNHTKQDLLKYVKETKIGGSTALYPASIAALKELKNEDINKYNLSVVLMTDGQANVGSFNDLKIYYKSLNEEIPIYSITFGNADEYELDQISRLTNGKVFDGKSNLTIAFKKVRGYN